MHTHSPQGENIPKNSHPCVAAARGGRKIFFGHTQCVHTPLVQKPVPTYVADIIGSWTGLIDLQTIIELLEALFETPLIGENVGIALSS